MKREISLKRNKRLRQYLHQFLYPYYRLTAPFRPLPNAVIVGAMKCGTTTLNAWLRHHPQVAFSAVKEVHFFDNNYSRGLGWYRSYFPLLETLSGAKCVIEATPAYIQRAPKVAERMHRHIPKARLILMLRDPVRRAISHYGHRQRNGLEERPMEQALLSDEGPKPGSRNFYKTRGLYAEKLEAFLGYYEMSNILVIKSEEFFAEPARVYSCVEDFLGLDHVPLSDQMKPHNVGSKREAIPDSVLTHLAEFYNRPNQALQAMLPEFKIW